MSINVPKFQQPITAERFVYADEFPVGMTDWAVFGEYVSKFRVEGYRCPNLVVVRTEHDKTLHYMPARELATAIEAA